MGEEMHLMKETTITGSDFWIWNPPSHAINKNIHMHLQWWTATIPASRRHVCCHCSSTSPDNSAILVFSGWVLCFLVLKHFKTYTPGNYVLKDLISQPHFSSHQVHSRNRAPSFCIFYQLFLPKIVSISSRWKISPFQKSQDGVSFLYSKVD